ncbi:MAG: HEAT repeat domain-containing protein [Myxococcota bacterium]
MPRSHPLAAAALGLLLLVAPATRAEDTGGEPSVADLLERLPKCESLEGCPATRALISRGEAIWPAARAGLEHDQELVRFWTLGVLSEVVLEEAREAIAARLDDPKIRVRAAAAYALGAQEDRAVTPWLLEALEDEDLNVRFAATVALARVKDPESVPGLIGALRDRDEDVRAHAALALGEIGDRRATPRLLERLREDVHARVRAYAATALGEIRDPRALEPLLRRLGEEEDAKALAATAYALGALGDRKALPHLRELEGHDSEEVRTYVREAIAAIEGDEDGDDEDDEEREEAPEPERER